jgi:predicted enzyme related to lactoylglutathione lyase
MQVDGFDKIAKNILDHGGAVALPKFAVPKFCWQGYCLDTEENAFGIFQPGASAA